MSVVIRSGTIIGNADAADDDEFLFEAFVHLPQFGSIFDPTNPKSIVVGRTGAGKTALARYIEKNQDNVIRIDPKRIALDHISNSDIISFFETLKVDLHLFYELLWKHVICVSLIKSIYNITDAGKESSFWEKLRNSVTFDRGKMECLEYLRDWGQSFWMDTDIQVKEIARKFEEQLKAGAEFQIPGMKFTPEYAHTLEGNVRQEVVQRAKKVVSEIQIGKLSRVMEVIQEHIGSNKMKKYFIVIDELDERWADERIQYKLIRSLVEVVKAFRKIQQLKILIVVRSDVLERALTETRELGFQREKFETYIVNLRWNQNELMDLVNRRLNVLFRNRYTKANVRFLDVFAQQTRGIPTFQYLVERTLFRPRDIIAFVNQCLASSEGASQVSQKAVQTAEQHYSRRRQDALIAEWQSVHPEIAMILDFLAKQGLRFSVSEITATNGQDRLGDLVTRIVSENYSYQDDLCRLSRMYFGDGSTTFRNDIALEILAIGYKIGALELKVAPQQQFLVSYKDDPVVPRSQITMDAEARIHPMLWRAMGLTPNI